MKNLMIFGFSKPTKQSLVVKLGKDIPKNGTKVVEKIYGKHFKDFFENWGN
jgi:hypothetical protein